MSDSTDNSNIRLKKRRKRNIRKGVFLVPKLIIVFSLVFLFVNTVFRSGTTVNTYTAMNGSIEEYVLADGYVFRDQTLVTSPRDGYFECVAAEGERVTDGATLAAVYENRVDPAVTEEIADIKRKINSLENDMVSSDVYSGSAVKIELNIAESAREMTKKREKHNFSDISNEKELVDDYIAAKRSSSEGGKSSGERLEELKTQLRQIESSGEYKSEYIYSPAAGVFSSRIDGYEEALDISMLDSATPGYLEGLKSDKVSSGETVTAGEVACKVINNYEWYFVGNVSEKEADNFDVGQTVSIKFYDLSDSVVEAAVTAKSRPDGGKVAVTVHSTRYIEGIYTTSKASAELMTEGASGIKVPSQALRVINGQQGVYVVRLGVARFVPVNLLYNNKEWAVIKPDSDTEEDYDEKLEIYDEVIINSRGIEDGKVVRQ